MSVSQQIQRWFDTDGCFLDGVALYSRVGGPYPVRTFEGYESAPFVPDRIEGLLWSSLRAYLEAHPVEEVAETVETPETVVSETVKQAVSAQAPPVREDEPEAIRALRNKARLLHKRQALVHAKLHEAETDEERYALAEETMEEIVPGLDGIYDSIREWQATGVVPAAPQPDVVADTVKKMLRISSLASRISRLKGLLKNKGLSDVERQGYEKELLEKEVEKDGIEKELGLKN